MSACRSKRHFSRRLSRFQVRPAATTPLRGTSRTELLLKLVNSGWERRIGPSATQTFRKAQRSVVCGISCFFVFIVFEGIFAGLAIKLGAILSPIWAVIGVGCLSYNIVAQRKARRQAGAYLDLPRSLWGRVPLRQNTQVFDTWIIKHSGHRN